MGDLFDYEMPPEWFGCTPPVVAINDLRHWDRTTDHAISPRRFPTSSDIGFDPRCILSSPKGLAGDMAEWVSGPFPGSSERFGPMNLKTLSPSA
jgi:hypothetical protein